MKREQLMVDADYYFCRASKWAEGLPGTEIQRVRVTDLGMWEPVEVPRWRPDGLPYRRVTGRGQGGFVLGVEVEEDGTLGRQHAVFVNHLRGPWGETQELVAENVRRREELEHRRRVDQEQKLAAARAATAQLHALDMKAYTDLGMPGYIKVRAEDVTWLLSQKREPSPLSTSDADTGERSAA